MRRDSANKAEAMTVAGRGRHLRNPYRYDNGGRMSCGVNGRIMLCGALAVYELRVV